MNEQLSFHTVEELEALTLEELQALWELVPTDRQRAYRAAYDREVRNAGAIGSDELEERVATELLKRYRQTALVPVGSRWARTPRRVQHAAQENDSPEIGEHAQNTATNKPSPQLIAVFGVLILIFLGLMLSRAFGGSNVRVDLESTATPTMTPTPAISPTPTPLALEAQDDVISGGDPQRTAAYPINLKVISAEADAPRVWVVQRRAVSAAEWNFDPNPDIASFINGMSVRPVIGIPYSKDNAALFDAINEQTVFNLTMNTGAILRFEFADKTQVLRSDTQIFRQVSPGLALLLIGERDETGFPTATRTLVTATYPPEQELSRSGERLSTTPAPVIHVPTATTEPTSTPIPFAGIDVQLIEVTTNEDQLTTRLRIYNGQDEAVNFTHDDIWLSLGYAADPPGPRNPAEGLQPFTLLPQQAVDLTLVWHWDDEPYAALQVGRYRWTMQLSQNGSMGNTLH